MPAPTNLDCRSLALVLAVWGLEAQYEAQAVASSWSDKPGVDKAICQGVWPGHTIGRETNLTKECP